MRKFDLFTNNTRTIKTIIVEKQANLFIAARVDDRKITNCFENRREKLKLLSKIALFNKQSFDETISKP